jgi:hypothetical protein
MTPEETVVAYLLEALRGITTANGYNVDIGLVELKDRMLRDLNGEDLPAVLASLGDDDFDRETFGNENENAHFRSLDLLLYVAAVYDAEEVVPGSPVKNAIVKCLLKNRCAADGRLPWDIMTGAIRYNEFERIENKIVKFTIPVRLKYCFTLEDL